MTLLYIKSELYKTPTVELFTQIEPFEQQYMIIADKDENQIFEGFVHAYISNSVDFDVKLYSAINDDLKKKVTVSYTDKTVDFIIKDLIDTYCLHLWYDAGIVADATDYTKAWKDKRIVDIFRWCDSVEHKQTSIRATNEVFWDSYTTSGKEIDDATTAINTEPKLIPLTDIKFGRFHIYGGYKDGVRLESLVETEPTFATYIDEFSEIVDQTELDAMATTLSTTWNLSIKKLMLSVSGLGFIETGTEVTVTLGQFNISAETWYVISSGYDSIEDRCDLVLTDATYQPPLKDTTNTDIYNLRQDVGTVEDAVNNPTGAGISPSAITLSGHTVDDILISSDGASTTDSVLVTPGWIDALYLPLAGGTMTDDLTMSAGKKIRFNETNYVDLSGHIDDALKITTTNGYATFGAHNTSWFHMYTDRASFYMGDPLYVAGTLTVAGNTTLTAGKKISAPYTAANYTGHNIAGVRIGYPYGATSLLGLRIDALGDSNSNYMIMQDSDGTDTYVNGSTNLHLRSANIDRVIIGTGDITVTLPINHATSLQFQIADVTRATVNETHVLFNSAVYLDAVKHYTASVSGRLVEVNSAGIHGYDLSSRNGKKDISTFELSDDAFLAITPKKYKYKPDIVKGATDNFRYGFIAEDIQDAVKLHELEDGMLYYKPIYAEEKGEDGKYAFLGEDKTVVEGYNMKIMQSLLWKQVHNLTISNQEKDIKILELETRLTAIEKAIGIKE